MIDDDVVVLRAISQALSGFPRIRFATRAEDALTLLDTEAADLILVDAELPGMSGLAFLEQLARRPGPLPKTLLVTAHRQPAIEAGARVLGALGVIYKPFTMESIVEAVAAALRQPAVEKAPALEALLVEPFRALVLADDVNSSDHVTEAVSAVCGWVEFAGSVEQALKRAWEGALDAIVMSPSLRHLDIVTAVRTLRLEPSLFQTPIIVTQSARGTPDELLALQAGASDVVREDASSAVLQARLVNLMRSKRFADFAVAAMRS